METQRRVVFSFGSESEVRYIDGVPEVGDRVTHGTELWLVSEVSVNGVGICVKCERPREAPVSTMRSSRDSTS